MEQQRFYQGEDISVLLTFFNDKELDNTADISNWDVEALFYTSKGDTVIGLSTSKQENSSVVIETISNSSINIKIPASETAKIKPGFLKMEIRMIEKNTGKVSICATSTVKIEESLISKINS